jgi:putative glutamine amidotransferase
MIEMTNFPLIGLTATRVKNEKGPASVRISEKYTQAVCLAGGVPVILPFDLREERFQDLVTRLDGILFTGGGDVHPERYGSRMHPLVDSVDRERDRVEIALARAAQRLGKPFFGICRGIQVINVALGGTLYEDVLEQMPGAQPHAYSSEWPRNHLAHPVQVSPDSRLAQILGGETVRVNSLHHQGVCRLAPDARPTAWAPDGLVEAIEFPDHPYGLAVQWHPEWLQELAPMRALFSAFVEAAKMKRET